MKWMFYLIVFVYTFYRAVYGATQDELTVERDDDSLSWKAGTRHELICKGSNKNQKIIWEDPSGKAVEARNKQDNRRIYVQERTKKASAPVLVLVLKQAIVEDTGTWTCRAGRKSETASVCVIDEAHFVNTATEVTVGKGGAITLSCEARGYPEPRLDWYRGGEVITDDAANGTSKYKVMIKYNNQGHSGLLTILSLSNEDEGLYTCEAIQEYQDNEGCSYNDTLDINLVVNYEPTMAHLWNDTQLVIADEDNIAHIECYADGHPAPTYRWYQQHADHDTEIQESMITTNSSASILTIEANESTFYNMYLCRATNPYGESSNVFKLIPRVAPEAPDELVILNTTDTTVLFSLNWKEDSVETPISSIEAMFVKTSNIPKGKPRKESDWKKAKTAVIDASEVSSHKEDIVVELEGLEAETQYWVRLRAVNDAGFSTWSKPIAATTAIQSSADEESTTEEEVDATSSEDADLTFYAIIFLIAIVVTVLVCVFIVKKM